MAYRNVIIQNPAHISVHNNQLVIQTDKPHHVSLEDISSLLLESNRSTITTAALSHLGQRGCVVYVCDEKHMPCAVLTPFQHHSRGLSVINAQLHVSVPRKKQLWQNIVQIKLQNQAACLQLASIPQYERIRTLSSKVRSGDSDNVEATGAQLYFPALFGDGFTRNLDCGINSALNYGYAILRGCMARHLVVYGFLPSLGLHHKNILNGFNLADDLMEPFRPVVDRIVYLYFQDATDLTPAIKQNLFNCLNLEIISGNQKHSVNYAMERLVQSLGRAIEDNSKKLVLPELIELKQHIYE